MHELFQPHFLLIVLLPKKEGEKMLVYFFLMIMYITMIMATTNSAMMTRSTVLYAGISGHCVSCGYSGSIAMVLEAASAAICC